MKQPSNYQNIDIERVDKSICGPTHTIKEVGQREPKWHVFHALGFDNLSLCSLFIHTKIIIRFGMKNCVK